MTAHIHPTAIIMEGAVIGEGSTVGPYSIIGPKVVLGRNNRVGPHVVIEGFTTLGDGNQIFQFASIGSAPQDLKYHGEPSTLVIGDSNIIREYVTLQPGTEKGGMTSIIGNGNLFMANSHLGHDGRVGNGNVIANSVALAGHVTIGNNVTVGGLAAIHQFVSVGDLSFIGGGAMVTQDIPPFCMAAGDRAVLIGLNQIGMQRRGYTPEQVNEVKRAYRTLFLGSGRLADRIEAARGAVTASGATASFATGAPESVAAQQLIAFVERSERGVPLPRRSAAGEDDGSHGV